MSVRACCVCMNVWEKAKQREKTKSGEKASELDSEKMKKKV